MGVLLDRTVYGLIVGVTVGQNVGASDLSSVPIICLKKKKKKIIRELRDRLEKITWSIGFL